MTERALDKPRPAANADRLVEMLTAIKHMEGVRRIGELPVSAT